MLVRRVTLIFVITALVVGLAFPRGALAKGNGDFRPETFRISGGDLPHPVTVTLTEYEMAVEGRGSWYTIPSGLPEPRPTATRYHLDVVVAADGSALFQPTQLYVAQEPARVTAVDGSGWAEPDPAIRDLLNRYIALGVRGQLSERPTLAESIAASTTTLGAEVTANGNLLSPATTDRFLSLLGNAEPVVFGVQGALIGHRNLHAVTFDVRFGNMSLGFAYVPPGPVASRGLLFNTPQLGNWGYIDVLSPPGYTSRAYTIPQELEQLLADLGFVGASEGDIVTSRTVPVEHARLAYGDDYAEVWRRNGAHLRLPLASRGGASLECTPESCYTATPIPPFEGEPLHVEIWPLPVDPFPEAVLPDGFDYYPDDASHQGHGVLVPIVGGAEAEAHTGLGAPYYPDQALDLLLRNAAAEADQQVDQPAPSKHSTAKAFATGVPAVLVGLLTIVWVSWTAERDRRRSA